MSATALAGRTAFVAGATGPVGRAVVAALAAAGVRVGVHHRTGGAAAQELVEDLPGELVAVGADLTEPAALDAAVRAVEDRFGPVGVLVNAAHPRPPAPATVAATSAADLADQLAGVQVHAALLVRVVPGMRAQGFGRIVYVSGALMARPAPGHGAYGAAKAAASVLTRYTALEEGCHGITANVVAPGRVVDPGLEEPLDPEQADLSRRLLERMALPTFPTPQEVADVVLALLASPAVTGQTVWVAGGEPIA